MFVCVYLCMYVCIYACITICTLCMYVCMYVCMCRLMYLCIYVCSTYEQRVLQRPSFPLGPKRPSSARSILWHRRSRLLASSEQTAPPSPLVDFMYVCIHVCMYVCMYVCMHGLWQQARQIHYVDSVFAFFASPAAASPHSRLSVFGIFFTCTPKANGDRPSASHLSEVAFWTSTILSI